MRAGLRSALVMLVLATATGAAAAAVWLLLAGGAYRPKLGLALMLAGALLALLGDNGVSRLSDADARAYLGAGPARDEAVSGGPLTPIGVFLFVSLPLLVLGGLVHGSG